MRRAAWIALCALVVAGAAGGCRFFTPAEPEPPFSMGSTEIVGWCGVDMMWDVLIRARRSRKSNTLSFRLERSEVEK